jgi:hypothetical protein
MTLEMEFEFWEWRHLRKSSWWSAEATHKNVKKGRSKNCNFEMLRDPMTIVIFLYKRFKRLYRTDQNHIPVDEKWKSCDISTNLYDKIGIMV